MTTHHYDELGFLRYLTTLPADQQLATHTITQYRCYARRWADHALDHGADPHRPDPITVRAWSDRLAPGPSTRQGARTAIVWICRWQHTDETVADAVHQPGSIRKPKWRSLRPATVARVLQAADQAGEIGTAIYLALYTGMRISEVCTARWEGIDWERGIISFYRDKVEDELDLPIHEALAERLAPRALRSGYLFPGRSHGTPLTTGSMSARLRRLLDPLEASGELTQHVTFHPLRHTAGTWLYEATGDLLLVQQFLGHADPRTTAQYIRTNQRRLEAGVRSIDYTPQLPALDHRPLWAA